MRLYDPESPFVLVDPTEIERRQAKKTGYVGRLSDGKTLGFWMIVFAQPYRGRAIPFHFGLYSEATLSEEVTSRNLEWRDLVWEIKELVGETPLVFDREFFSAQRWLEALEEAGCEWVVRLNTKSGVKITDEQGEEIPLVIEKGEKRRMEGVCYRGLVKVNVSGVWPKDQREPLWVMGSLKPDRLVVGVYEERMKIEQTFKDSKSLLDLEKVMNKKRGHLEITLALVLLAYGLGLMVGEAARDEAYGGGYDEREGDEKGVPRSGPTKVGALFWAIRAVEEATETRR